MLYLINSSNQLEEREIKIASTSDSHVVVTEGLEDGDRVVLGPVPFYIQGMSVNPILKE